MFKEFKITFLTRILKSGIFQASDSLKIIHLDPIGFYSYSLFTYDALVLFMLNKFKYSQGKGTMMNHRVKKISADMHESQLRENLEKYKTKAIEIGASKACIFSVKDIPVDERVTLKCQVPRCFGYGVSMNCPPNTIAPDELRTYLRKYKWAIFFIKDVPPEVIVRDKATIKERVAVYQDVYKIVTDIESMAFYDGHYFAFGLGAGSCRHTFCGLEKTCRAMEGERCRFSLRARPSMEAVGIDVYKMIAVCGWDIYPIGSNARPDDITKGTLAGIIIVQ